MSTKQSPNRATIALTTVLTLAFCAETYISSGWSNFAEELRSFRADLTTRESSMLKGTLKSLVAIQFSCEGDLNQKQQNNRAKPKLSLWFSPYRQFPEVNPEGDQRGAGDYEYFNYIPTEKCQGIASNYGSYKNSRADRVFQAASSKGLRAELLQAANLGYNLFILDTKKIWLAAKDDDRCKAARDQCKKTSDSFMVIQLAKNNALIRNSDFLANSIRLGVGSTIADSLESKSLYISRSAQWHDWESSKSNVVSRWSNGSQAQETWTELVTPVIDNDSPANLRTIITSNPSLRSISLELDCTRIQQRVRIDIQGSKDISKIVRTCLPRAARVLQAKDATGKTIDGSAPRLSKNDSRKSFYAVEYLIN